jgi:ketosteroid isomerase-like protein
MANKLGKEMKQTRSINQTLILLVLVLAGIVSVSGQSRDEKMVREVLDQNLTAFMKNDLATMDRIWANDEGVTVFENGHANWGWADYRNNHLAPEMKEMTNVKYTSSDLKLRVDGKTAWCTFKYAISGDSNDRHFDSSGLGTAVLEKRDGRWVIVHWHTSAPRRPPAPSVKPS